jgi:hypothetical protein
MQATAAQDQIDRRARIWNGIGLLSSGRLRPSLISMTLMEKICKQSLDICVCWRGFHEKGMALTSVAAPESRISTEIRD